MVLSSMRLKKILAWTVHLYTASGLILAAAMAVLIVSGQDRSFRMALGLMILATVIDSTDGWLARRVRVKEVVPGFDGRRLDDLVDFQTYTAMPLFLLWRAQVLHAGHEWLLVLPLLASAYGFCQVNAKTADGFFLGFPSYWNVVAFYLYMLSSPEWFSVATIVFLSLLTFLPLRYLYPSQRTPFNRLTSILAAIWAVLALVILFAPITNRKWFTVMSLWFPIYYMGMSWILDLRHRLHSGSADKVPPT
jgi:phosphatidylcholine synthase